MDITITQNVKVTKTYDYEDIWEALSGSDFVGCEYWITEMDSSEGEEGRPFPVTHLNPEGEEKELVTTMVSKEMIIEGFRKAVVEGATHCYGYPIEDLEDYDGCFPFQVLQYAIFGKLIFG